MNENILAVQNLMSELTLASTGQTTKFSVVEMETKLKEAMVTLFGKEKVSPQDIEASPNRGLFYQFIAKAVAETGSNKIGKDFSWAEVIDTEWGDENVFYIENSKLYDVVTIAKGNGNVRRQRLEDSTLTVATEACAIKIFAPYKQWLAGRIDWSKMLTKIADSYSKHVKELTLLAFYGSTPVNGNAAFNRAIAGAFDEDIAYEIVDHVQAENQNSDVIIIGTRIALKQFAPLIATEQANKDMYENGVYTTAEGYNLVVVDQMHIKNTYDFLLSNKQVMIIPGDLGQIVKIVQEGSPIVASTPLGQNADMSVEHLFYREIGVAVVTGAYYGKLTWTA